LEAKIFNELTIKENGVLYLIIKNIIGDEAIRKIKPDAWILGWLH
jgi:hypothetical protein